MNDSKHTPGPWTWHNGYGEMTGGDGSEVFTSEPYEGMWLSFVSNQDANARLIAAAPELLEALEECLDTLEQLRDFAELQVQIRAAIAKAKGEVP